MHNSRRLVQVQNLTNTLDARSARESDPYATYGTEVPRIIPGSKQFWRSFGLDLVSFVEQRGVPDFFLTLTAYDGWPQIQATLQHGWGAKAAAPEVQDLARKIYERQAVGHQPVISVLAAERRYQWFMKILRSEEGRPLVLFKILS